jgi:hypothetical protein
MQENIKYASFRARDDCHRPLQKAERYARPGEGQTKDYAKSKREMHRAKNVMNNE